MTKKNELYGLNSRKKSVLLVKVVGEGGYPLWAIEKDTSFVTIDWSVEDNIKDLYLPENFHLVWNVVNWAYRADITWVGHWPDIEPTRMTIQDHVKILFTRGIFRGERGHVHLASLDGEIAQREILDRILWLFDGAHLLDALEEVDVIV